MSKLETISKFKFYPLTKERWSDFELLFGDKGACGGCWCMNWRFLKAEFDRNKGVGNKKAMKKIVNSGEIPGLMAYKSKTPIGWIAVAPREAYPRLEKAPTLRRIDEKEVWSISCIFLAKEFRQQGVSVQLIQESVKFAKKKKAKIVEGYSFEPNQKLPDPFVWTGMTSSYLKAGFKEAARFSKSRPIMRYYIK